jgi:integrase
MAASGIGPATLRRIHACLCSALSRAVKARRIAHNPALLVDLPAVPRRPVMPWEPSELGQFLDHVQSHRLGALFELMASCGLRRGEALGLRWADVDLAEGVLIVRQQLVYVGKGAQFGPPKTAAGEHRRVELDRRTVRTLLAHQLSQSTERAALEYRDLDLVFAQSSGQPYDPAKITKTFTVLAEQAGVRRVRLHDLRHGTASLMLAAGVPIELVSKRLGHASIAITLGTYSHLLEGVGRQAAEAAVALVPRAMAAQAPAVGVR